jgi:BirA family biotin operon repressor/biotin-[acetyl-CoA-carboxylase] ligase
MKLISFNTLPSTNLYAKKNIDTLNDMDIVLAAAQTAGKGRLGRGWISAEGGLYFSLFLKPAKAGILQNITQAMALSVCCVLRKTGAPAHIKWPNDILCERGKICGILSEAVFEKDFLKGIITGVGINVSQAEIKTDKPAVSLKQLGIKADRQTLLGEIMALFTQNYGRLLEGGFSSIKTDYKALFPYLGKEISISTGHGIIKGIALDLDDEGKILLKTAKGTFAVSAGDMYSPQN